MICDRCKKSDGGVLKSLFTPDGWEMSICSRCRKEIDKGASMLEVKNYERPSRWAKKLRREDAGSSQSQISNYNAEKYEIASQKPFAHCKWAKKEN